MCAIVYNEKDTQIPKFNLAQIYIASDCKVVSVFRFGDWRCCFEDIAIRAFLRNYIFHNSVSRRREQRDRLEGEEGGWTREDMEGLEQVGRRLRG